MFFQSAKMFWINCGEKEGAKICKKLKVNPKPATIQYFRQQKLYKEFLREETSLQLEYFIRFPEADGPWSEDPKADSVQHIVKQKQLKQLIQKKDPMLIMFYTPWCGACKSLKPVYAEVAKLVHDEGIILAAVDCELGKDTEFHSQLPFNVTAFPTMFYYQRGKLQFKYNSGHKKEDILNFLDNPAEKPVQKSWSDKIDSKTVHLTSDSYDSYIAEHSNVMIFFHAMHAHDICAEVMIEWDKAAEELHEDESQDYFLAAVDCDAHPDLKERFKATYIPHIIYYQNGQVLYDNLGTEFRRNQEGIINYLKTPTKPEEKGSTWDEQTQNVSHLTAETFKKTMKKFKHGLVMFYTPWCGACKEAKPQFSIAADELQGENKVTMVGLDCVPYKSLCKLYGVNSYPTLMYFHYGKNEQVYSGSRSSEALVNFMSDPVRGLAEQATETVPKANVDEVWNVADGDIVLQLTTDSLAIQRRSTEKYLLYLYGTKCGICNKIKLNIIEALKTLEEEEIDAPFYAISTDIFGAEIIRDYDFWDHGDGVPCFMYFDGSQFLFDINPRHADDFVKFFKDPKQPKKKHQDPDWSLQESAEDIYFLQDTGFDSFMKDQEEMLVMFYSNSCGACSMVKPFYEEAAKLLAEDRPVITLAAVDLAKANELGKRYNINSFPQFYYFSNGKMRFQYHGGRKTEKIVEFCKDPTFIEQPKIEGGFEIASNVTILANQADEWIQTTESCLVMVHTAWCGHCKSMKPGYIMAADDLKDAMSSARLAAIEGDRFKSWLAPYGVTGFPTLIYFENGDFKYNYGGPRTREAIVKFMMNPDPNFSKEKQAEEQQQDEMLLDIPDEVVVLDHKTFEDFVEQYQKVVVMFYAPWCGVCKNAKPSFFEAAELMADDDDQVRFGIFNADSDSGEDKLYVQQFDITGYPSIWFFDDGEQKYRFSGHHNVDSYLR